MKRDVSDSNERPAWLLLIAGDDGDMARQQADCFLSHAAELESRDLVVVTISRDDVSVVHGDCRCSMAARDLAEKYGLSFEKFSSALIDESDCVKWAAPLPVCYEDIISVIDEMPRRDAENATRGPAPVE